MTMTIKVEVTSGPDTPPKAAVVTEQYYNKDGVTGNSTVSIVKRGESKDFGIYEGKGFFVREETDEETATRLSADAAPVSEQVADEPKAEEAATTADVNKSDAS